MMQWSLVVVVNEVIMWLCFFLLKSYSHNNEKRLVQNLLAEAEVQFSNSNLSYSVSKWYDLKYAYLLLWTSMLKGTLA